MYDENQSSWVIADKNSLESEYGWYDYENKKWANAVLVKENGYSSSVVERNKSVNIDNSLSALSTYTSSNHGIDWTESTSIFTFTTGSSGGTFSFDYSVSSENNYDKLSITLNEQTIVDGISGVVSSAYTTTLSANTAYTMTATYSKDVSNSTNDDQAVIENIVLPNNLASNLTVTAPGDYGWTSFDVYSLKTFDTYTIGDSGKYVLEGINQVSSAETINKYICSDTTSIECDSLYQIKTVSGNTITGVDEYNIRNLPIRATYLNSRPGTRVEESNILAFYVWIPRFKYKVWNKDKVIGTTNYTYDAYTNGIDIIFENNIEKTGTITCNYSYGEASTDAGSPIETCIDSGTEGYYTHPAFTFGNNELTGFWMGKFEISSSNFSTEYGGGETIALTPRIIPNGVSWRGNTVSNYWKVIKDMQVVNNIYGLDTKVSIIDSHMITNMEWGAVAYLTHSKYGRCTSEENKVCEEITINSNGSYKTGYSNSTSSTYFTTNGMLASTTGNIYGVYDMSGGAQEYVMGNISSSSGNYNYNESSAGSYYSYNGNEKYLTTYTYGSTYNDQTAYNRSRLGDATGEIITVSGGLGGWYSDYAYFAISFSPYFYRGGYFDNGMGAGVFSFDADLGGSDEDISSRAVLAVITS